MSKSRHQNRAPQPNKFSSSSKDQHHFSSQFSTINHTDPPRLDEIDFSEDPLFSSRPQTAKKGPRQEGILIQGLVELFNKVREYQGKAYIIRCSYFEIYNDSLYDLLGEGDDKMTEPLQLSEDIKVFIFP